jgi:hypothetical protein
MTALNGAAEQDEADQFIEDQFKIFDDAVKQINDNAIAFHKERCAEPDNDACSEGFMIAFMIAFDERIKRAHKEQEISKYRSN